MLFQSMPCAIMKTFTIKLMVKVKNDHRSKFSNLSNWKEEAWKKKSGLQWDSNPWPPHCRCVALPTELWSHTLGVRSIYWVHISREEWNVVKYMYMKPWFFFSGFFFPIGKFTVMIILHFHVQPQFKYELFHILHIKINGIADMMKALGKVKMA